MIYLVINNAGFLALGLRWVARWTNAGSVLLKKSGYTMSERVSEWLLEIQNKKRMNKNWYFKKVFITWVSDWLHDSINNNSGKSCLRQIARWINAGSVLQNKKRMIKADSSRKWLQYEWLTDCTTLLITI